MGFHLSGIVHDVVFRRVVAINAWDTVTDYRNGDGFVAERGTYGLRFEDTQAIVNMDGGYDSKASDVTFVRANAWGNKRNFRIWGSHVVMDSIRQDPVRPGGGGTLAQVGGPSAGFTIWDSSSSIATARSCSTSRRPVIGVAVGTIVRHHPRKTIFRLAGTAEMTLNGKQLGG